MRDVLFYIFACTGCLFISSLLALATYYVYLFIWTVYREFYKFRDDFVEYVRERKRVERAEKEIKKYKESGENESGRIQEQDDGYSR